MKRFPSLPIWLIVLLVLGITTARSQVNQQWVARYNGTGNGVDDATAVVTDSNHNVYVTGTSFGGISSQEDFVTIKYNSDGIQQWAARYDGPAHEADYASAIAVDNLGNVYVTGSSQGSPNNYDYATIKYNATGVVQWVARYNSVGNGADHAYALAIDNLGNSYVTGQSLSDTLTYGDCKTIKYNSAGVQQWVATYNGPGSGGDLGQAIIVDVNGNIFVTGTSLGNSANYDFITIKYNSNGVQQWAARYDGSGNGSDYAIDIAIDGLGNILVTGQSEGIMGWDDYATVKYNSLGVQQWAVRYATLGEDYPTSVAADIEGNVYVTGCSEQVGVGTFVYDYVTIKYNSSGVQRWLARYNGPGNGNDRAHAMCIDNSSNVYVTGTSLGIGTGDDYTTIKYDQNGNEQWVVRYNGPANGGDAANDIAVDEDANVLVTGESAGIGNNGDYATIKYNQVGLFVSLTPYGTPIVILQSGGSFNFNILCMNNSSAADTADVWCMVTLPNGFSYGPVLGPVTNIIFPGNTSVNRDRTQYVGAGAPAGNYMYRAFIGNYPNSICNQDSFPFSKSGDDGSNDWFADLSSTGDPFASEENNIHPFAFNIHPSASPNPFNPSTVISYQLPAASHVQLSVYDVSGRLVCTLVNGWREAGEHEVTFDGSGLPSGVYLYRLEARKGAYAPGEYHAVGKMVLLK